MNKTYKIIQIVSEFYNVTPEDILGQCRKRSFCIPRATAIYLARKSTSKGVVELGREFNRDHSSICYAIQNVEAMAALDMLYDQQLLEMEDTIREAFKPRLSIVRNHVWSFNDAIARDVTGRI